MIPIVLGLIVLVGVSYAWLKLTLNGTTGHAIKAGNLSLVLDDKGSKGINMEKALPMSDEVGLSKEPYHFTLENEGSVPSRYTIYLDDVETSKPKLNDEIIRLGLSKDEIDISIVRKYVYGTGYTYPHKLLSETKQEEQRVLDTGIIYPSEIYSYDLRLWIDSTVTNPNDVSEKVFNGKIRVVGEQLIPTPEECFTFEKETGTITAYLCGTRLLNPDRGNSTPNTTGQSPAGRFISDVVIPKTIDGTAVTKIDEYVFGGGWGDGTGITSVGLPEGLKEIGYFSFCNNQITSVTIPSTVNKIGTYAFENNQLTYVTLSEGVEEIDDYAFSENPLTTVIIPASVTKLHHDIFYQGSLTKVIMKGKRNVSDFVIYGSLGVSSDSYIGSPFDSNNYGPPSSWPEGSICKTHATEHFSEPDFGDNTNPCIQWES